jgi:hypothetical protein
VSAPGGIATPLAGSYPHVLIACGEAGSGKDTAVEMVLRHEKGSNACVLRFAIYVRRALAFLTGIKVAESMTNAGKSALLPRWCLGAEEGCTRQTFVFAMEHMMNMFRIRARPHTFEEACRAAAAFMEIPIAEFGGLGDELLDLPLEKPRISVGRALQLLGTDVGRELMGAQVWTDKLVKEWESLGCPPLRIPDGRFPSEIADMREAIAKRTATGCKYSLSVWKLTGRGGAAGATGRDTAHPSETSQSEIKEDALIDNSGTLDDLAQAVAAMAH